MNGKFAERLRAHDTLFGTIVSLNCPAVAEIIAAEGFDWIFIDAEHGALPIDAVENLVRAAGDTPCLVRIADRGEVSVKQALEVGAAGIIVPQVNSAHDATAVAAYAKYPPVGRRGVGVGRANAYGMRFADYLRQANRATVVVAQIEHVDAVENAREIVSTDGIDAVLIGPNDLAASMGYLGEVEHPDVEAAIDAVRALCAELGKPIGIFHGNVDKAVGFARGGYTLVATGIDTMLIGNAARHLADRLRD